MRSGTVRMDEYPGGNRTRLEAARPDNGSRTAGSAPSYMSAARWDARCMLHAITHTHTMPECVDMFECYGGNDTRGDIRGKRDV